METARRLKGTSESEKEYDSLAYPRHAQVPSDICSKHEPAASISFNIYSEASGMYVASM